jgi:hypothetical protein
MRNARIPQSANPDAYSWKDSVLRKAANGEFDPQRAAQRSSLIKLASSALDLHVSALARDVCPRDDEGGSQPLAAALTALKTAATNR